MRKVIAIAAALVVAAVSAGLADAQVRLAPPVGKQPNVMILPPRQKAPRVQQPNQPMTGVKPPRIQPNVVVPPSGAINKALSANPGAKPLGVKLRNQSYIVRLKQGGTIKQLSVDSVTGVVTPLP